MSLSKTLWILIIFFSVIAAFFTFNVLTFQKSDKEAVKTEAPVEKIKTLEGS